MLDGGILMDENRERITPEDRRSALKEYSDVLRFVHDWDSGLFTLSQSEYLNLPEVVRVGMNLYREEKDGLDRRN